MKGGGGGGGNGVAITLLGGEILKWGVIPVFSHPALTSALKEAF